MANVTYYDSPLGRMLLASDGIGLTGVWFEKQKYYANGLKNIVWKEDCVLSETKKWLDIYFSGKNPSFLPAIHMTGTLFQKQVWNILLTVPYGATITYGEIAGMICKEKGLLSMSAQAVGGAVGHNKISILIPCHRVIGRNGSLTGYAGGLERKVALLKTEGVVL